MGALKVHAVLMLHMRTYRESAGTRLDARVKIFFHTFVKKSWISLPRASLTLRGWTQATVGVSFGRPNQSTRIREINVEYPIPEAVALKMTEIIADVEGALFQ